MLTEIHPQWYKPSSRNIKKQFSLCGNSSVQTITINLQTTQPFISGSHRFGVPGILQEPLSHPHILLDGFCLGVPQGVQVVLDLHAHPLNHLEVRVGGHNI